MKVLFSYLFCIVHMYVTPLIRNAYLVQKTFSLAWLHFSYLFLFYSKEKVMDGSRTDAKLNKNKRITVCLYKYIQYLWCFILTAVFSSWTASTSSFIGFPLQYQSVQASDIISLTVMWMILHVVMSDSKCWGTQFDQV